jgi:hypothetical protein
MEQRDLIIIGLIILLAMQHYEVWKLSKDAFYSKVRMVALMKWLEEVHKIKPPRPEEDETFAKIIFEIKENDFIRKNLND